MSHHHCPSCEKYANKMETLQTGYAKVFIGPMFSGKSSALAREATTHADVGHKVIYINHVDDQRNIHGDDFFSTHHSSSSKLSDKISCTKVKSLLTVDVSNYDVVAIDECQFYDDLLEAVTLWVKEQKKIVLCAGLNGDAFQKPFGQMLNLIPFADEVIHYQAKCHQCLKNQDGHVRASYVNAPFTARLVGGSEQKLIGAGDTYVPLCRFHYEQHRKSL